MTPRVHSPIRLRLDPGSLAVREALGKLVMALKPLDLDQIDRGTVELVVAEVLNNIVEHAHGRTETDGVIEIVCVQAADGLHLAVTDTGMEMPGGRIPTGRDLPAGDSLDGLPEGGFGWYMINRLAKDVRYSRRDGVNRLEFRLAVGRSVLGKP